ncbi:hypothetical protein PsAD26_03382 [Pseudovibrio sp. Ad26]|nr:hypothetical protein PsAD26_03382 [Pseudovibrio sp. Ad26]
MFLNSWVLDWFVILSMATIAVALVAWLLDRVRKYD